MADKTTQDTIMGPVSSAAPANGGAAQVGDLANVADTAPSQAEGDSKEGDGDEPASEEDDEESDYGSGSDSDSSEISAVTLEQEGMITEVLESSYLSSRKPPKYHWCTDPLDYDSCTAKELEGFIIARGLKNPYPAGLTLKYFYIRILEKADRESQPFRFLDLPPEMRNMVYVDLLTLPEHTCGTHCICFPQILRTCRQVYKEAGDILYAENRIMCAFGAAYIDEHIYASSVLVHMNHYEDHEADVYGSIPSGMKRFPDFLRRVQNLTICVSLECEPEFVPDALDAVAWLSNCLLNLASFLMDDHHLKKLHICFHTDDEDEDYALDIMYPLRRIRNVPSVEVSGDLDCWENLTSGLEDDIRNPQPAFNTFKSLQLLGDEAKAYLGFGPYLDACRKQFGRQTASSIKNGEGSDLHESPKDGKKPVGHKRRSHDVERALDKLTREIEESGAITSQDEEDRVLVLLDKLQRRLSQLNRTQLARKANTLANASSVAARYAAERGHIKNPKAVQHNSPES